MLIENLYWMPTTLGAEKSSQNGISLQQQTQKSFLQKASGKVLRWLRKLGAQVSALSYYFESFFKLSIPIVRIFD